MQSEKSFKPCILGKNLTNLHTPEPLGLFCNPELSPKSVFFGTFWFTVNGGPKGEHINRNQLNTLLVCRTEKLIGRMRWSSELCELTFAKTNFWKVIEIEIMREWSHSKTVTHVLQMLSYFKTVFKTKGVLCCVTCCVTIMDSKVKYIWYHRPTLVFFLSFIPFEVSKFSFAPRAFVYNISWSWQRESRQSKVYVKTN